MFAFTLYLGTLSFFSSDWLDLSDSIGVVVLAVLFGLPAAAQVYRYRRVSTALQRQQTKWVVLGLIPIVLLTALYGAATEVFPEIEPSRTKAYFAVAWTPLVNFFATILLTVPLAIAILRYRLWDVDVVLNRALVYGSLTATLAGTYIGSVVLLQMAFRGVTGQGNAVAIVISTLTISALFMPLRRRIQEIIDRRFFRRRYDAALTLAAFSARMRDEVDVDRLTGELVAVVEGTMQPEHVSLWLRQQAARRSE